MHGICDNLAIRRLISEAFDSLALRRLLDKICDTLAICDFLTTRRFI